MHILGPRLLDESRHGPTHGGPVWPQQAPRKRFFEREPCLHLCEAVQISHPCKKSSPTAYWSVRNCNQLPSSSRDQGSKVLKKYPERIGRSLAVRPLLRLRMPLQSFENAKLPLCPTCSSAFYMVACIKPNHNLPNNLDHDLDGLHFLG
jgi:hypothetical protein